MMAIRKVFHDAHSPPNSQFYPYLAGLWALSNSLRPTQQKGTMRQPGSNSEALFQGSTVAIPAPKRRFPDPQKQRSQSMNQSGKKYGVVFRGVMFAVLCAAVLLFVVEGQTRAQSLMTRHVREANLKGQAQYVGRLPETQSMRIDIVLPLRDPAGLDSFLEELYEPSSPSYRHFLTVEEFTAKFGPTQEDYDAVIRYAKTNGLSVVGGSRDGMDVQAE